MCYLPYEQLKERPQNVYLYYFKFNELNMLKVISGLCGT